MSLTVLYDEGCPFCRRCRAWVEGEAQLVPLSFVALSSAAARSLTGGQVPGQGRDLVVIADGGAYWVGTDAFLVCLWALDTHRAHAMSLAHPWLRPFTSAFFDTVSSGRHVLSALFGGGERCEGGHCGVAPTTAYR